MSFDYTTTWRAVVGDELAFIDHIKSTMTAVLDWRASKTGQPYTSERTEIESLPTSVQSLLPWIVEKHKARVNGLVIGDLWNSPEFPLYNVLHRYPSVSDRTPVNLIGTDIELWVLDGAVDIGWVKRPIKSMFNGSLSTKQFRGAPVMILCRSKHYTPKRGLTEDETIENKAKLIKTLVLEYCAYGAIGDQELQALDTASFVNPVGQTPPSFLDAYVKQSVFGEFKTETETGIHNIQHAVTSLSGDIEAFKSETGGLDVLKNQVAVNKNELYTQNTRIEWNSHQIDEQISRLNEIEGKTVTNGQSISALQSDVQGVKLINNSIRSEQAGIKQDIENLKASHLNPDDYVTKTSFWSTVEQMPTTQGMRGEIRDAIEQSKTDIGEDHYTKQEADGRFAPKQRMEREIEERIQSGLQGVRADIDTKVSRASDAVKADTESKYVKKTEVADLKKLQEQLGKVDISSFATRSQLAQQQQTIEEWSNQRFELKGAAGNLVDAMHRTITSETDTKVNGLSGRINAAVNETNELRKSTRQNLDSLSSTVSAQDTRITNGLSNLKVELQNSIDRKMPNLSASDGMLVVADNSVAEKWKASHYSLSVDNLIKEREEGFILNGTGRMTDGTGRGGFDYSTIAFAGASGSFSVPANLTSERNIFFTDRIKLKEKVFKVSMDARQSRIGTSKFRLNIRWFTRSGVELNTYLRKEQSTTFGPSTISEWVIAPSDAEYCEVGIVNGTGNPAQLFTNIKVQFAQDIPEEILWQFVLGEQYRHEKFAETPIWINCYVTTHNTINVQGIINRADLVPVGALFIGGTNLPTPLAVPYFNLNSPYGGLYPVQRGDGLSLEARFNVVPVQGLRMGTSFKSLSDIRHFPFNAYSKVGTPIAKRPMVGLNNNGTTGY